MPLCCTVKLRNNFSPKRFSVLRGYLLATERQSEAFHFYKYLFKSKTLNAENNDIFEKQKICVFHNLSLNLILITFDMYQNISFNLKTFLRKGEIFIRQIVEVLTLLQPCPKRCYSFKTLLTFTLTWKVLDVFANSDMIFFLYLTILHLPILFSFYFFY